MQINNTIKEFIDILDTYARGNLEEKTHLSILLQLAGDAKKESLIGELSFHGKYLWKLFITFSKEPHESDKYEKLQSEFVTTVGEFQEKIKSILLNAPSDIMEIFHRHFFSLSNASLKHLLSLARDFSYLKNWELELEEQNGEDRS